MSGDQIDSWWTVATCVGTALGVFGGALMAHLMHRHEIERLRGVIVSLQLEPTHCGGCDECDQLAFEPFTDAEVDRAFEALRYHLARRRGLS